jgi:hypothetical protein
MGPAHPQNMPDSDIVMKSKNVEKPKKYARSQLEVEAYRQRWIQITLTTINIIIGAAVALRVFGLI